MSSRCRVRDSRAGSGMRKLRTANDRQEMVVAGMTSTGEVMNLLYRDIRLRLQATSLLGEGRREQREWIDKISAWWPHWAALK